MPMPSPTQPSWPIGLLLLLAVAGVLYALMLANALYQPSGGGEASLEVGDGGDSSSPSPCGSCSRS